MPNITNFTCQDNTLWPLEGPARAPARGPVEGRAGRPAGDLAKEAAGRPAGPRRRIGGRGAAAAGSPRRIGGRGAAAAGSPRRIGGRGAAAAGLAAAVLLSWLAYIPRRLGDRLFTWNDTEAYWRGWQITKVHGGLGRRYRDPRFDTLTACPQCQGGGTTTKDTPCAPCLGTGRVSTEEVS